MHSPPSTFRPMSFTSIKRPRSPGSPTQERQTKRPALAPISGEVQGARRVCTAPEGGMARRLAGQDDWVRQAMELSIASPLSVTVGFQSAMEGSGAVAQTRTDEHMAVDYEEPQTQALRVHVHPGSLRPWTARSHLPSIHITTTPASTLVQNGLHAPSPAPFSVLTEPPSSSTESASSTGSLTSAQRLCPPDIFLLPATPSDTPSQQTQFTTEGGAEGSCSDAGSGFAAIVAVADVAGSDRWVTATVEDA
ncbi:hypothetical protein JVU11DRAFT_982 [Chiua virens]|nr:hypothetical protein JVU11DRAFT_982 [Chiua virens]